MDLFKSDFKLPQESWLILPGPSAAQGFSLIPSPAAVIAVGYAITAPVGAGYHFIDSHIYPFQNYWREPGLGVKRIYSQQLVDSSRIPAEYTFNRKPLLSLSDYSPQLGSIRAGGSSLCGGLQVVYHFSPPGAVVNVIGADMWGSGYYDGLKVEAYEDSHWMIFHKIAQLLVKWIRSSGMIINFLTPTALKV